MRLWRRCGRAVHQSSRAYGFASLLTKFRHFPSREKSWKLAPHTRSRSRSLRRSNTRHAEIDGRSSSLLRGTGPGFGDPDRIRRRRASAHSSLTTLRPEDGSRDTPHGGMRLLGLLGRLPRGRLRLRGVQRPCYRLRVRCLLFFEDAPGGLRLRSLRLLRVFQALEHRADCGLRGMHAPACHRRRSSTDDGDRTRRTSNAGFSLVHGLYRTSLAKERATGHEHVDAAVDSEGGRRDMRCTLAVCLPLSRRGPGRDSPSRLPGRGLRCQRAAAGAALRSDARPRCRDEGRQQAEPPDRTLLHSGGRRVRGLVRPVATQHRPTATDAQSR